MTKRWNRSISDDERGIEVDYQFRYGDDLSVRLILPDLRYYKDDEAEELVSERQWQWIEEIFASGDDDLTFIMSGIQLMASNRLKNFEVWPKHEVRRLMGLVQKYRKNGVVLVSGDVHFTQVLNSKRRPSDDAYKLYEITTSGLTHTCDKNIFGKCSPVLNLLSPKYFHQTKPVIKLNYATFEIEKEENGGDV